MIIKSKGGSFMHKPKEDTVAMGMRIQQSRKAAKLTQMQFSEKIGVSTQYISDLERGIVGCSISTLIKICDILDVSSDFILRGKEPAAHNPIYLSNKLSSLSPREREIMEEGFDLLKKAFSVKSR